jgi:3-oxoacyl-[acyl-carrier-protein] synthase-3
LFGDGVGAFVVRACEKDAGQVGNYRLADFKTTPGIYVSELHSDGREADILKIPYGTANRLNPEMVARGEHFVQMDGKAVFKFAVKALVDVTHSICAKAGIEVSEIDHFVSHQANQRILQLVGEQLGLDKSKIPMNIEKYGNTSAGTVPILLDEELEAGRIKRGDLALFTAIGSGMAWGGILVRL